MVQIYLRSILPMFARSFMPPQFRKTKTPKLNKWKPPTTEIDNAFTTRLQWSPSQQEAAPLNRQRLHQFGSGTFKWTAAPSSRPRHLQAGSITLQASSGTLPQMAEPLQGIAAPFSSRRQQGEGTVAHLQQTWTEAANTKRLHALLTREQVNKWEGKGHLNSSLGIELGLR